MEHENAVLESSSKNTLQSKVL